MQKYEEYLIFPNFPIKNLSKKYLAECGEREWMREEVG
jgi:hypothetical protein